jgi:hypothetical protein
VLNDRERGVLAHIERDLVSSDPHLARLFQRLAYVRAHPAPRAVAGVRSASTRSMRDAGPTPCILLITGLALLVLGGISAALPIVGTGVVMIMIAFVLAAVGNPQARPGPA